MVMSTNTPRNAYVTQTGLNVAYDVTDSIKADLDVSYSGAWNKYDNGNTFLVVGTRNTGLPMTWTNPNNGNMPYYDYSNLIQPNDSSALMAHCCSTGGNHLSNKGDNYKLHLSKSFTDGVLSRLNFGVQSTDTTLRQISYNTTFPSGDALDLCKIYCGYNIPIPASAINAGGYNAGSWFSQQSQGFPSQWLNYDMNKLLAYLISPAAIQQIYDYRNGQTYSTPADKAAALKQVTDFAAAAKKLGYYSVATAALLTWEWLQREEHVFGAFEISHYRPTERPNSVRIVHPKNGEEAWWPLFDEMGEPLFPELMAELDAIKAKTVWGLVFRRDHEHRRSPAPLPWPTERKDLRYLRSVVKKIVAAAGLRSELSFTSFRHGGFTEGADSDLTDAELRAAARHRSSHQMPTYAKRTRKQLIAGSKKRREERARAALVGLAASRSSE